MRRTTSGVLPRSGQRLDISAINPVRSSKPAPYTIPARRRDFRERIQRPEQRLALKTGTGIALDPASGVGDDPCTVGISSKKSATSGRYPARRAAAARARPGRRRDQDRGAGFRRSHAPGSRSLAREHEGVAEIEAEGGGGGGHALEQTGLSLLDFTSPMASGPTPRLPPSQFDGRSP